MAVISAVSRAVDPVAAAAQLGNASVQVMNVAYRASVQTAADAIKAEERALKRLGLLDGGADLAALLETLYGQALPVAYFEGDGRLSVVEPNDSLDAALRAQAARELDRALTDQNFGIGNGEGDPGHISFILVVNAVGILIVKGINTDAPSLRWFRG